LSNQSGQVPGVQFYQRFDARNPLRRHTDIRRDNSKSATNLAGGVEERSGHANSVRRGALAAADGHATFADMP